VDERKDSPFPEAINPDFPMFQFASTTERISLIVKLFSAGFNVYTITDRFSKSMIRGRQRWVDYDLTQYLLSILEFGLVVLFLLHTLFRTTRFTAMYTRRHFKAVWFGLFLSYIPEIGNANALWAVNFWNVDYLMEIVYHSAHVKHSGSRNWDTFIKWTYIFIRLPFLLFLVVFPAVGIFCRLVQVKGILDIYIKQWGVNEWILFLGFINNFRFISGKPGVMSRLGKHLIEDEAIVLFADILDTQPKAAFTIATLIMSTGPEEMFEMVKPESRLWLKPILASSLMTNLQKSRNLSKTEHSNVDLPAPKLTNNEGEASGPAECWNAPLPKTRKVRPPANKIGTPLDWILLPRPKDPKAEG
jgi:hypothetical protein